MMGRAPNEAAITELEGSARLAADDAGLARALAIAQLVSNHAGGTDYAKGEEAIALYRRLGNRIAEGIVLNNCANAAMRAGALGAAAGFLSSAAEVLDAVGESVGAAVARANLALVHRQRGEVARTTEPLEVALATCRATGMVQEAASVAISLALALAMTDGSAERIDGLVADVDLASFGPTFAGDEILLDLAAVALHRGRPSEAAALLEGRAVDFEATTRVAGNLKAWTIAALGDEAAAIEQLRKQLASTPPSERLARMFDEHALGVLLARCGEPDEPHRSVADALARELGVVRFVDPPLAPI
jgi:tetratricopeptide (TPR) repeat protein